MRAHLAEAPRAAKFSGTERRMWLPGARRRENWDLVFTGDRVSVLQDKKILEMVVTVVQ